MKSIITNIIILALLILPEITVRSQSWEPVAEGLLPIPFGVNALDVVDENTIWAFANDQLADLSTIDGHIPRLLRSTDGGESWQSTDIPALNGQFVTDIYAFDDMVAFITTDNLEHDRNGDAVFKTTDGGQSWEEKFKDEQRSLNFGFYDIHFFSQQEGIFAIYPPMGAPASRASGVISTDGGDSWALWPPNTYPPLQTLERIEISIHNENWEFQGSNIWVGTRRGRVFKSENKGVTWQAFETPFSQEGSERKIANIAFKDEMNGLALSYNISNVRFCRTADGGQTWQMLDPPAEDFQASNIEYVPGTEETFVVTADAVVPIAFLRQSLISKDFGETWQLIDQGVTWGDTDFLSQDVGWSSNGHVMEEGEPALFRWNGGDPTAVREEFQSEGLSIYPNPFTDRIFLNHKDPENRPEYALIYDADGRMIRSEKITSDATEIHLHGLPAGTYCMQLIGKDREWAKQLVKIE